MTPVRSAGGVRARESGCLAVWLQIGVHVSEVVHKRFGRTILELGGNNATISTSPLDENAVV